MTTNVSGRTLRSGAAAAAAWLTLIALITTVSAAQAAPPQGTDSRPAKVTTTVVSASRSTWLDSGVRLTSGMSAKLKVTGDATCDAQNGSICPIGQPEGTYSCSSLGWPPGPAGDAVPTDALAGRIGDGQPFVVGRSKTLTGSGRLYLVFNDCEGAYYNNSGSFSVDIELTPSLTVDWEMPERLSADAPDEQGWGGNDGLMPLRHLDPASWKAEVFLRVDDERYTCPADERFAWAITPLDGGKVLKQPKPGCSFRLEASRLGRYKVTATRERRKAGGWRREPTVAATRTVLLKDWVIVGLGDSNGSGEGNPPFFFERCNRSTASYQFQTALYLEHQDPHTSVTFLHASCSGARIEHLVSRRYEGTRPSNPPLRPQIAQIANLLSAATPARDVDAALVSVGVNDLAFGPLMKFCIQYAQETLTTPGPACPEISVRAERDAKGRIVGYEPDGGGQLARTMENLLLKQLPARYPPLARALVQPIKASGLGLSPRRVIITRYPDFSHGPDAEPCDTRDATIYPLPHWAPPTWTWFSQLGTQLNRKVEAAAAAADWKVVPVNTPALERRGYCNLQHSLFVGIYRSIWKQNTDGPFHPNEEAHQIARHENTPILCSLLYRKDDCTGKPR